MEPWPALPETLPWQAMRSAAGRAHQAALLPLQARRPLCDHRARFRVQGLDAALAGHAQRRRAHAPGRAGAAAGALAPARAQAPASGLGFTMAKRISWACGLRLCCATIFVLPPLLLEALPQPAMHSNAGRRRAHKAALLLPAHWYLSCSIEARKA